MKSISHMNHRPFLSNDPSARPHTISFANASQPSQPGGSRKYRCHQVMQIYNACTGDPCFPTTKRERLSPSTRLTTKMVVYPWRKTSRNRNWAARPSKCKNCLGKYPLSSNALWTHPILKAQRAHTSMNKHTTERYLLIFLDLESKLLLRTYLGS